MSEKKDTSIISNSAPSGTYIYPEESNYFSGKPTMFNTLFKNRWVNHILFWVAITLVTAYHGSLFGGTLVLNIANMLSILPIQMLVAYLIIYVFVPRWLYNKAWLNFSISFILLSYISIVVARLSIIYIAEPIIRGNSDQETFLEVLSDPVYLLKVYFPGVFLPAIIFFLIKMTKERFTQRRQVEELIREKQAAELNFLKAQMNPHMLFNTLNNIYSLAKQGSEDTPEMILKLSEILDYTLYECNEDRVGVSREWELIENYADLEALRYGEKLDLVLIEDIDDKHATIAPLILITLVENAFKYGLASSIPKPGIRIELKVEDKVLTFSIANSKSSNDQASRRKSKIGIGIKNVKKQLFLQYPDRHELSISNQDQMYNVKLTIEL